MIDVLPTNHSGDDGTQIHIIHCISSYVFIPYSSSVISILVLLCILYCRHSEWQYIWCAEQILLDLVKHLSTSDSAGYRPLARVGVARVCRQVDGSALRVLKVTAEDPNPYRYGAFEIQVAYKHPLVRILVMKIGVFFCLLVC